MLLLRLNLEKCKYHFVPAIRHYEIRHEEAQCPQCGEIVNKKHLKRHISQKHTAIEDRKLKCSYCPKAFFNTPTLRDHTNTHTGEKPYVCKYCGKGSASKGTHRGHERSHEGFKRTK